MSSNKSEQAPNAEARRQRAVLKLKIAAGELSPKEADAALQKVMKER